MQKKQKKRLALCHSSHLCFLLLASRFPGGRVALANESDSEKFPQGQEGGLTGEMRYRWESIVGEYLI